ncbi:hypothetical protein RO3G_14278 [Rhizopus delemar RA 99-880]|uniref:FYVE-type domain-containing protein n=3 Tax=Rhizopus TaxID=4842 RepID=I1CM87_RHIO9|nr:hypothetical protein RO3G_14278 [Rhizopus delemar RA 99-880]|eukprot:EIE89567.1 hypothetical protein RO3G_14278 [Rhizopus delemar RA 99-880]
MTSLNKPMQQKRPPTRQSAIEARSKGATDKQQGVSNFNSTLSSVKLRLDEKKNKGCAMSMVERKDLHEFISTRKYLSNSRRRRDDQCSHHHPHQHMVPKIERGGVGGLVPAYASSESLSSISSSSSSSSSSSCKTTPRKYSETNNNSLWPFAQPPPLSSKVPIHQLRETIIEDLTSSVVSYSNQIQDLSNAISVSFSSTSFETLAFNRVQYQQQQDGVTYKSQIQECKALIVQQHELLNKLQELVAADEEYNNTQPIQLPTKVISESSSNLLQKFKDTLVNPTGITQLVIRQNKMKKKDTIISIQGVCETMETSLIPNELLPAGEKKKIYHLHFKLDLNQQDRLYKFTLLPSSRWQKDDQVNRCQFKTCSKKFSLLQRKHHCRRCGDIYCSSHSQNRLPLFTPDDPEKTIFSRVCDSCFFALASEDLSPY